MADCESYRRWRGTRRVATCLRALLLVWLAATPALAQRLDASRLKSGSALLSAFEPVVARAAAATVRLESDGKTISLGAIVDSDGYVLTKASELRVKFTCRLSDRREFPATIVGVHSDLDLALLKIEADGELPVVPWSDDRSPMVGQLLASTSIGETPLAVGVVSVPSRSIPRQPGVLGILLGSDAQRPEIEQVFPESGAARAGLQVGDIILAVAGSLISDKEALSNRIRAYRPGDRLQLVIRRGGNEQAVEAVLGEPYDPNNRLQIQNRLDGGESSLSLRRSGFKQAIQHDSVLRPQDCGGPLVALSGKVVGINIARAGRTESYAIPAGDVLAVLDDLKSGRLAPPARKPQEQAAADALPEKLAGK